MGSFLGGPVALLLFHGQNARFQQSISGRQPRFLGPVFLRFLRH